MKPQASTSAKVEKQKQIQAIYDQMYYGAIKAVANARKRGKAEGQWTLRRNSFPYPKRNGFSGLP
jgi:hypothetical protein